MAKSNTRDDTASKIKTVLRRYFEAGDDGELNAEYDPNFSAQDAIDEIKTIVGGV